MSIFRDEMRKVRISLENLKCTKHNKTVRRREKVKARRRKKRIPNLK